MTAQPLSLLPTGSVYLERERPLAPQIYDDLKTRMLSGQYPQNGPLPTLSALTEFYGATDQAMCNVLARLVKEGWILREGRGSYKVAAIIPPPSPSAPVPAKATAMTSKPELAVMAEAETPAALLYCPTCGMWARFSAPVLEAFPAEITLTCTADFTRLLHVRLDPAKRVGH